MSSTKKHSIKSLFWKLVRKCSAAVVIAFLLLFSSTAATAQQLPLDSVLQQISANNPTLQQYASRARAMDAYAAGATSWKAPMVGAGVFMQPYTGQEAMTTGRQGSLMLSAEQAIPNPARQRAKQQYLNSRAAIEDENRAIAYNNLRAQAKAAYYSWVVEEKKLAVLQENERLVAYMLKLARIRYPYSQGSLGSIYKAEARLHEVENMQLMVASEIAQQRVQLNTLMNNPKEHLFSIDTLISLPAAVQLAVNTTSLQRNRSDIHKLDRTIASMQLNTTLESLERKPDFSLSFNHMRPFNSDMPDMFTAMGMVSIPIAPWASKGYKANTKAMNLEIEAMQHERENMLNEAQGTIRQMALELNSKREQVENYKEKILPALKKNYDVTMLAYEQNTAQLPEVIDAWEALNIAQLDYLNNLEQLYKLAVNYEREIEK
ncbi:TolC family protein [Pontibacter chitinilyticus]|uniref:TolC family protein n=1 Tax=Pontibacter chitinilyticus TaxID=2674989 RepID=UPI00321920A0